MVYMNISVVEKILGFHVYAPLDACTYYGLDNGADPIQVQRMTRQSLFCYDTNCSLCYMKVPRM